MPMPGDTFMADRLETFDSLRDRITARYDDLSPHLQRLARTAMGDLVTENPRRHFAGEPVLTPVN